MNAELQKLKNKIESSQKILLINHLWMDWDALGSLWALYLILQKMWKDVKATNDCSIPDTFSFLWISEIIVPQLDIEEFDPDLIIALDSWDLSRLWESYTNYSQIFQKKDFAQFDHHVSNDAYADINIIKSDSTSTCELLYQSLEELWMQEYADKQIATLLMMWILTDTNIFYNTNTTLETFQVATELFELWGDTRLVINELFRKKDFVKSKLWGESLAVSRQYLGWKIVGSIITEKMLAKTWMTSNKADVKWFINLFFANIDGALVAYVLCQTDKWVKWSLRSNNENIDVAKIAATFGWGWHARAAWLFMECSLEEAEEKLINKIKASLI